MEEFNVQPKLVGVIKMIPHRTCKVKIRGELSENFMVGTGLRQGDPLSILLINVVFKK